MFDWIPILISLSASVKGWNLVVLQEWLLVCMIESGINWVEIEKKNVIKTVTLKTSNSFFFIKLYLLLKLV